MMDSAPPPEPPTTQDRSNGFEWPVVPELNPWRSIAAYLALGCATFGAIVPMLPIVRGLYPFAGFVYLIASIPLFASLLPASLVHGRACGGLKSFENTTSVGLGLIPLFVLVLDAEWSAGFIASIYRQTDRGNHFAYALEGLSTPLIFSWLPAALLVAITARVRKVRWEKCWLLGLYWLSFGPSAALVVCLLHWSGVRFDKW